MTSRDIEKKRQSDRRYYLLNKEKVNNRSVARRKIMKSYYAEYHKTYDPIYRDKNRIRINKQQRERHSIRRENDICYRMAHSLRSRLYKICRLKWLSKMNGTLEYIWCEKDFLIKYIESKFLEWMSWDNRSEWHIDHIIPLSSFNLAEESEIYKAMNYMNLQPLWASDNIKKSNR